MTETDRRRGVAEEKEHRDRQEEGCSRGKGTQRQTGGEV